jgi:hypothetical protein
MGNHSLIPKLTNGCHPSIMVLLLKCKLCQNCSNNKSRQKKSLTACTSIQLLIHLSVIELIQQIGREHNSAIFNYHFDLQFDLLTIEHS